MPILIVVPLLIVTYNRFPLTHLIYGLIVIHAIILAVGGHHYTYAKVPLFEMIRDNFGHDRNSDDKIGHFTKGFIPALVIRELLLRTSPLRAGKWLFAIIVFACLGISAVYEILEWSAAFTSGENANDFLGTQGDEWDTQKDMFLAGIGAVAGLLALSRLHDKALNKLTASTRRSR